MIIRRHNITKQNDDDDRAIIDRIGDIEATLSELRQQVSNLAIDVSYLKPSFREDTPDSESDTQFVVQTTGNRNKESALKILEELKIEHGCKGFEIETAVRQAACIAQTKKGRDHNRTAACRIPVKSQIAAWFVANYVTTSDYKFENVDFVDQLIAISDLSPAPINWSLRSNDALAMRWMDMAWNRTSKTTWLPF